MVQLASLTVAIIATSLAPMVAARNCKTGLNYCGYNLLNIGNYAAQINQALSDAKQHIDSAHIHESIFHCNGGSNGDITWLAYCGSGCQDGGSGKSDFC
ncbi:hypothetical protein ASPACDRAFT_21780 [Aspergillus aculeatus ATCC 16872]|uniref:Killer toxin Kp4 domain-containing protein n=1 Tax=Aspergillus aculeatus (strain ATCC 16872 / CBS 172.66 / WB 5094) TaxID=690307 RepID=A0A1L9X7G0_ASPA1|nr:uncharacterized protein ASPACDRAFT_21780 [Aspergillus aculeatus ATCC 16872]OJK04269.1 hypothetical protein ASPACDRAFT_21780 [Aspergillus aculeatus ATCC 16872]